MKHFKELDGVRAVAALMVMWFHFYQSVTVDSSITLLVQKISKFGQTGVSLFFVLSGFLITRILLSTKRLPNYFTTFYIRRALRIFPLYYFFLVIYYFVIPLISAVPFVEFNQQIYYWIYFQGFAMTFDWPNQGPNHYWSLAVEEHFYFFWPLLIYYLPKKTIPILCIGVILLSILIRFSLIQYGYGTFYFTYARMDELAIGSLLAVLEIHNILCQKNNKLFLSFLIISSLFTIFLPKVANEYGDYLVDTLKPLFLGVVYFNLIGFVISIGDNNILKTFLKSNFMIYIGKISYGLYVYHPVCFTLFCRYFCTGIIIIDLLGSFLVSFVVSSLSYYLFESKFLLLKRYFDYSSKSYDKNIVVGYANR